jgi:hypothetical protein
MCKVELSSLDARGLGGGVDVEGILLGGEPDAAAT